MDKLKLARKYGIKVRIKGFDGECLMYSGTSGCNHDAYGRLKNVSSIECLEKASVVDCGDGNYIKLVSFGNLRAYVILKPMGESILAMCGNRIVCKIKHTDELIDFDWLKFFGSMSKEAIRKFEKTGVVFKAAGVLE